MRAPCWKQSTGYIPEDLQARHVKYVLNQKLNQNQLQKIHSKYINAKQVFESSKNPTDKQKRTFKTAKRKYEVAQQISCPNKQKKRKELVKHITLAPKKPRQMSKAQYHKRLDTSNSTVGSLEEELQRANEIIKTKTQEIDKLKNELKSQQTMTTDLEIKNLHLLGAIENLRSKQFKYHNIKKKSGTFKYISGLSVQQFDLVMECIKPYVHLIPYPGCVINTTAEKSVDIETQFLAVLTICRHGLDLSFMGFILEKSVATVHRIFNSWVIFLSTLFNRLELKPADRFLIKKMPEIFIDTGHGLTDIVIDATEFKFQHASNFELNSLMFSNYKNTVTGKSLIGIAPHGMGIFFSDIYPGSISDSDITEKSGVLQYVEEEHEVMSDRGFAIQEICAIKGVTLNRPKQKDADQFSQADVKKNFDIAATRIHVERFIGRVRDWSILNNVWPLNRMDIVSSTWQMLCHIVNITMPPIGPKQKSTL